MSVTLGGGHEQDYYDGEAFRRLRESMPDGWEWQMKPTTDGRIALLVYRKPWGGYNEAYGVTLAEAADRAREWLERTNVTTPKPLRCRCTCYGCEQLHHCRQEPRGCPFPVPVVRGRAL